MKRDNILKQWGVRQNESSIQKAIVNYLRYDGWLVMRFNNTGMYDPSKNIFRRNVNVPGISDLICLKAGIMLCVEVKTSFQKKIVNSIIEGKIPTTSREMTIKNQLDFINNVIAHGGQGFFCFGLDDLIEKLTDYKKGDDKDDREEGT